MTFDVLLEKYGWAGLAIFLAFERVWPWLRELTSQERRAKLTADQHERERVAKYEERQIAALEAVSQSLAQMNARNANMDRALEALTLGMTRLLERMPHHSAISREVPE
jgi:predicted nuclease with TOPRIM domain